jgi:hypothetical protein
MNKDWDNYNWQEQQIKNLLLNFLWQWKS